MVEVSERVLAFAKDQYEDVIVNLLDDPSPLFEEDGSVDTEEVANLRELARDLGFDFDEVIKIWGTEHEYQRLIGMLETAPGK